MVNPDWIEHRRGRDRELLGWIVPEGDVFIAVDLLGRQQTAPVDWHLAEQALELLGISYLADPYQLHRGGEEWVRVRITEISADAVTVSDDHGGAIGAEQVDYQLPLPTGTELRPADGASTRDQL